MAKRTVKAAVAAASTVATAQTVAAQTAQAGGGLSAHLVTRLTAIVEASRAGQFTFESSADVATLGELVEANAEYAEKQGHPGKAATRASQLGLEYHERMIANAVASASAPWASQAAAEPAQQASPFGAGTVAALAPVAASASVAPVKLPGTRSPASAIVGSVLPPMAVPIDERRGRTAGGPKPSPFDDLPAPIKDAAGNLVASPYFVAAGLDPVTTRKNLSSAVSMANRKHSRPMVDAGGRPVMETVEVTENGVTKQEQRQAREALRRYITRKLTHPNGTAGFGVFRTL